MNPLRPHRALRLNPALRIYPRAEGILAWLPEQAQPLRLSIEQLGRIGSAHAADDYSGFSLGELNQLCGSRLLLESAATCEPAAPVRDLPPAAAGLDLPPALRMDGNACLQPGERGWIAWSPVLEAYCRLDNAAAELALRCADGTPVERLPGMADATRAEQQRHLLAALLHAGLLLPATRRAPRAQAAVESVHLANGDPWAGLSLNGRRPIYFVTHHVDHLPLALGMLRAAICGRDDGALLQHYLPLPIVSLDVHGMQALFRRFGPGIWLFSNYMWSADYNRGVSAAAKAAHRDNLTIHGGPSAPKYEQACARFMHDNPHVDIVVRGEGEDTLLDILHTLAGPAGSAGLAGVAGITYRPRAGGLQRTPERARVNAMDELPSPYLSGMFEHYGGQVVAAILETNRGCPFACTFCDWGSATAQKIRRFDLDRVKAEIDWIGAHGIRVLWIADANYGVFPRDVEIAEHIAATKARYGYPREVVVNYPKNATDKIADIVKIFARAGICGQGIISIQTTDPTTLAVIRRDNIKTRKYDELGEIFRRENLPLSTDLMIGLPGATVASFKADLQYYFDDDVGVKAYRTQLLPNSPMADPDYLREHAIRVDANSYLVATASYTEAELIEMEAIWNAFDIADGYALLRYVLRYLQWDHAIPATEVIHALVRQHRSQPSRFPALTWVHRQFLRERLLPGGWAPYYAEVGRFIGEHFAIAANPGLDLALRVNQLMMPVPGRRFPQTHELAHDFVSYFEDHVGRRASSQRRLTDYPPGSLAISDPYRMCELDYRAIEQYDNHQVFFELASPISRRRSVPNFVDRQAGAEAEVVEPGV